MSKACSAVNTEHRFIVCAFIMGQGSSTPKVETRVVVRVEQVESEESKAIRELNNQLDAMKAEVMQVPQVITDRVKETFDSKQDALLIRYSDLKNKEMIANDVRKMFGRFPFSDVVVDTAAQMIESMQDSKAMKEAIRWHERKQIRRVGDKVVGIELHYKIKLLEETHGTVFSKTDTLVLVAYKVLAHSMEGSPDEYFDKTELDSLTS